MGRLEVRSGRIAGIVIAVAAIAGCSGPDQSSNEVAQSASASPDSARAGIEQVTRAAIEDYNTGDLTHLESISCGQLGSELAEADAKAFAVESAADRRERGSGQVIAVDHIKTLKEFATASIQLQYEKGAAGLDARHRVFMSATLQTVDGSWKICGMHS